jgi:hypothetical protein
MILHDSAFSDSKYLVILMLVLFMYCTLGIIYKYLYYSAFTSSEDLRLYLSCIVF